MYAYPAGYRQPSIVIASPVLWGAAISTQVEGLLRRAESARLAMTTRSPHLEFSINSFTFVFHSVG